jgi:hypothetical protein
LAQDSAPVEIELMTHSEIYAAIHQQGKTTVIIYNGGTEQRGPHAVLGGHRIMARVIAPAIARKLGNALVAPVLPFSPAGSPLESKMAWNRRHLCKPVQRGQRIDRGQHGGERVQEYRVGRGSWAAGRRSSRRWPPRLDAKYSPKGTHVYYSGALLFQSA